MEKWRNYTDKGEPNYCGQTWPNATLSITHLTCSPISSCLNSN